eukprot:Skav219277  [mRNA]  locus=scaffold2157:8779:13256:- [translate_table: standard]
MVTSVNPTMTRIVFLLTLIHSVQSILIGIDCKGSEASSDKEQCSGVKPAQDKKKCEETFVKMGKYSVQCKFNGVQCISRGPVCTPSYTPPSCKMDVPVAPVATVSPSKYFTGGRSLMADNLKVWDDRNYGLGWSGGGLLQGATYYRLAYHKSFWNSALTLDNVKGATVIFCSEQFAIHGRDCGYSTSLPNNGFKKEGQLLNWRYGNQQIKMDCYSKKMATSSATIPASSTNQCVQALLIKC